jgi:Ohr subfamily peroxiredoxin
MSGLEPQEATMAKALYTAKATVTGGRSEGHGVTDDGELDVQLRAPDEGGGTNPEQLFAVGWAACFEGAIGVVGRRERAEVGDVSIASQVSLIPSEDRTFRLAAALDVTLPQVDDPSSRSGSCAMRTRCARTRTPRAETSTSR